MNSQLETREEKAKEKKMAIYRKLGEWTEII